MISRRIKLLTILLHSLCSTSVIYSQTQDFEIYVVAEIDGTESSIDEAIVSYRFQDEAVFTKVGLTRRDGTIEVEGLQIKQHIYITVSKQGYFDRTDIKYRIGDLPPKVILKPFPVLKIDLTSKSDNLIWEKMKVDSVRISLDYKNYKKQRVSVDTVIGTYKKPEFPIGVETGRSVRIEIYNSKNKYEKSELFIIADEKTIETPYVNSYQPKFRQSVIRVIDERDNTNKIPINNAKIFYRRRDRASTPKLIGYTDLLGFCEFVLPIDIQDDNVSIYVEGSGFLPKVEPLVHAIGRDNAIRVEPYKQLKIKLKEEKKRELENLLLEIIYPNENKNLVRDTIRIESSTETIIHFLPIRKNKEIEVKIFNKEGILISDEEEGKVEVKEQYIIDHEMSITYRTQINKSYTRVRENSVLAMQIDYQNQFDYANYDKGEFRSMNSYIAGSKVMCISYEDFYHKKLDLHKNFIPRIFPRKEDKKNGGKLTLTRNLIINQPKVLLGLGLATTSIVAFNREKHFYNLHKKNPTQIQLYEKYEDWRDIKHTALVGCIIGVTVNFLVKDVRESHLRSKIQI